MCCFGVVWAMRVGGLSLVVRCDIVGDQYIIGSKVEESFQGGGQKMMVKKGGKA
jgi:hypothetical protein